ncbi:hypothetical protein IEQ34_026604 [Dendrobium chrysotoxum]|uniref:Uncharacterized protein n=1 Tax=Dendrobium chrysotoxum TaxID=161865 RepID=A0AAV7FLY7_DENCH|nr:hypothetical protein IEQ34_026604 [Dendrobium chrysotoxum]
MADGGVVTVYGNGAALADPLKKTTFSVKVGLAQMLRGGVIMDVVTQSRRASLRRPAPARSWPWNASPLTSARRVASLE